MGPSGHQSDNSDEPLEQSMSSSTQSHEISDIESSRQGNGSSAEEEVDGPQPQVANPAQPAGRTVRVSTPFALSLMRRLGELKVTAPQNNPITEEEAANILASIRATTASADESTSDARTPSTSKKERPLRGSSSSTRHSAASPTTNDEEPIERTRRRKEAGRPKKSTVIVSRRSSSTRALFVPKAKVSTKNKKPVTGYNTFRTNVSKLLGTKIIKDCRNGPSFNSNISALWREVSDEDKAAFGDWTAAKQKEYLIKLATGPLTEEKKGLPTVKRKGIKAVTRVQPKRGVEGKTKK